jgi:hypothetical protein
MNDLRTKKKHAKQKYAHHYIGNSIGEYNISPI